MVKRVICVLGPIGSGKSTVTEYLKEKGFASFLLSQVVSEKAQELGLPTTRANLQKIGTQLRAVHGMSYVAKATVERVKKDRHQDIVMDGVRNEAEVEYIREQFPGAQFLYVETDYIIRKERIIRRGRWEDPSEVRELEFAMKRDLDEIKLCKSVAGVVILTNNETLENLYELLAKIL